MPTTYDAAAGGSFERFFKRHFERMLQYTNNRVHSQEDARDIVQRAFMGLLRALKERNEREDLSPIDDISPFFWSILKNEIRTFYRRQKRQRNQSHEAISDLVSPDDSAVNNLERKETHEQVRRRVDSLPEKLKRATVQFYFDGRSIREIAKNEGCSVSAVKDRLFRARTRLNGELVYLQQYKSKRLS